MTATSAQVMSMYQTIGNHGVRIPLTLVEGCEQADGTYTDVPDPQGTRVVSEYAADTTVNILENVVTNYHLGPTLAVPGYRIAAKSGTAEVARQRPLRLGPHRVGGGDAARPTTPSTRSM